MKWLWLVWAELWAHFDNADGARGVYEIVWGMEVIRRPVVFENGGTAYFTEEKQ